MQPNWVTQDQVAIPLILHIIYCNAATLPKVKIFPCGIHKSYEQLHFPQKKLTELIKPCIWLN